jgi:hypothetical protein
MNAMQMLSSEAWVERLGWTLIHFLWLGLSIALLYAAARRIIARRSSPNGRYLLACAALAAMMAAPLATWRLMQQPDASPAPPITSAVFLLPLQRPLSPPLRCPIPSAPQSPAYSRHSSWRGS